MSSKIRKLAEFVYLHMDGLSVAQRIQLYDLLSEVMPSQRERMKAAKAAWALRESENAQLVFGTLLPKRRRAQHDGHHN